MPRYPHAIDATFTREARFAEVVRTFEAPVSRYLVRLVGDVETARDLAQDTFLSAYRAWPDPEPAHLGAWLYRIATNHALSHLRRRRIIRWVPPSRLVRRGRTDGEADADSLDHPFPTEPSPGDAISEADAITAILDAMAPRDRSTLLLHAAGFSGAEIGGLMAGSPASARTRLSRARARFRERYTRLTALSDPGPFSTTGTDGTPPIARRHLTLLRGLPARTLPDPAPGHDDPPAPPSRSGGSRG